MFRLNKQGRDEAKAALKRIYDTSTESPGWMPDGRGRKDDADSKSAAKVAGKRGSSVSCSSPWRVAHRRPVRQPLAGVGPWRVPRPAIMRVLKYVTNRNGLLALSSGGRVDDGLGAVCGHSSNAYMPRRKLPADIKAYFVRMGRQGGKIGGRARAESLSPERRKEIAQKAIAARWAKREP
jgi:hypothetical protein